MASARQAAPQKYLLKGPCGLLYNISRGANNPGITEARTVTTKMTVEEARAALEAAEAEEHNQRMAIMKAIRPIWEYTIVPIESGSGWDPIWDDTVVAYKISGRVTNEAEAKAAGHSGYFLAGGGMRYLFNTVTGKLIGPTGGGTIYLSAYKPSGERALAKTLAQINDFIRTHPEGGDITEIITAFRQPADDE
jgi:hypothetical protein